VQVDIFANPDGTILEADMAAASAVARHNPSGASTSGVPPQHGSPSPHQVPQQPGAEAQPPYTAAGHPAGMQAMAAPAGGYAPGQFVQWDGAQQGGAPGAGFPLGMDPKMQVRVLRPLGWHAMRRRAGILALHS
jgi:hypothetical protein